MPRPAGRRRPQLGLHKVLLEQRQQGVGVEIHQHRQGGAAKYSKKMKNSDHVTDSRASLTLGVV